MRNLSLRFLLTLIAFSLSATNAWSKSQKWDEAQWKKASHWIASNKTTKARRLLLPLLRNSSLSKDLIYLTLGRLAFQEKKFSEALQHYSGVRQDSHYWLEAKEEMAWTYIRLNKPEKAIASGATLLSPIFLGQLGPEPYFMMSYASLMICDYEKVFDLSEKFKSNELNKVAELEKIVSKKKSEVLQRALKKLKQGPYHTSAIADELPVLPRDFLRDITFRKYWKSQNITKAYQRVQTLARAELKEYRAIIHKLHLVEAEVIQRLHLLESKIGQRKEIGSKVVKTSEVLTFPETDEIWVDELDNYHFEAKDCPKIMQVKL